MMTPRNHASSVIGVLDEESSSVGVDKAEKEVVEMQEVLQGEGGGEGGGEKEEKGGRRGRTWEGEVEKVEEEIPGEEVLAVEVERAHLVVEKACPVGDWEGLGDSGLEDRSHRK
ncbi:hypothetical protein CYMTET_43992 [Cymbomonas tetramitiformis]|uniref:Uncharacterized protein n=1 Tax=Cymbomonas tetramitiformis TaxID=36881 RepID=A0AAE0F010_9CHLO|nr:hypothetical protein CYMTET_43992 [Cymbomonas tetramitiformis]